MAAVNVTITGVIIDLYGRTITGPIKLVGEAVYSDLGVGGGPIVPPPGGGQPPRGAHPEHPIYYPPGTQPHPEHPIVIPPPIPSEPPPDGATKPPPDDGGWGYHEDWGWVYKPAPGEPSPKS